MEGLWRFNGKGKKSCENDVAVSGGNFVGELETGRIATQYSTKMPETLQFLDRVYYHLDGKGINRTASLLSQIHVRCCTVFNDNTFEREPG
jgi:hypothetical protein